MVNITKEKIKLCSKLRREQGLRQLSATTSKRWLWVLQRGQNLFQGQVQLANLEERLKENLGMGEYSLGQASHAFMHTASWYIPWIYLLSWICSCLPPLKQEMSFRVSLSGCSWLFSSHPPEQESPQFLQLSDTVAFYQNAPEAAFSVLSSGLVWWFCNCARFYKAWSQAFMPEERSPCISESRTQSCTLMTTGHLVPHLRGRTHWDRETWGQW